nr:ATP synthase F0 subunit 8 [Cochlostyla marinduquensis]UIX22053.1 ATP synthase F0 subunit 8 [Cochlostyla marinduquensis]
MPQLSPHNLMFMFYVMMMLLAIFILNYKNVSSKFKFKSMNKLPKSKVYM